jgi:hypothetical protein
MVVWTQKQFYSLGILGIYEELDRSRLSFETQSIADKVRELGIGRERESIEPVSIRQGCSHESLVDMVRRRVAGDIWVWMAVATHDVVQRRSEDWMGEPPATGTLWKKITVGPGWLQDDIIGHRADESGQGTCLRYSSEEKSEAVLSITSCPCPAE